MRNGFLGSVGLLLTGAGLALAQAPAGPPSPLAGAPAVGDSAAVMAAPRGAEPSIPAPGRLYLDADYLFWFSRPTKLPPLLIQGNPQNPGAIPAIGQPNTTVLIGDREVDAGTRSGARARVGAWLDSEETFGVEASGFIVEQIGSTLSASSNGSQTLGLSFRDVILTTLPPETSLLIAAPGVANSSTVVHTSTRFWGAELDALVHVSGGSWYRADALFGARYLQLEEELSIASTSVAVPVTGSVPFLKTPVTAPASLTVADSFRTRNEFYGAQVGAHILLQRGIWFADFRATLAPGVTHERVGIDGTTSLASPAVTATVPGGLYAQLTNVGGHSNNQFTLVPEGDVSVGCQVTSFLRAYVGYSAVYWAEGVFRPATELDRQVVSTLIPAQNATSQIPPAMGNIPAPFPHPEPQLRRQDFWGQGVHFGVELDF